MSGPADWGVIQLGRLTLRETFELVAKVHGTTGERSVSLKGQESLPPLTLAEAKQRAEDLMGMSDMLVPVTFGTKSDHDGFYVVADVGANVVHYTGNEGLSVDWTAELVRVGATNAIDLESRLTGGSRATNHVLTPERWHAPAIGHIGYFTGTTQPTAMTRTGADGAMTVYRDVPANVNPRWGCAPAAYQAGRVRFIDATPLERAAGQGLAITATTWELNNGLVRAQLFNDPTGVLTISAWDTGAWTAKTWDIRQAGVTLGMPSSVTMIRNDFEMVTLRLMWNKAPGRTLADLTLRRGSRFLEVFVQTDRSSTLLIRRAVTEAGTAGTGFVRATANDAAGNRFVVGSAKTFTNDVVNGGLSLAATTTLDAFIGCELNGSGAVAGDAAADLIDQYLGCMAESTAGVRR